MRTYPADRERYLAIKHLIESESIEQFQREQELDRRDRREMARRVDMVVRKLARP